jgi:hypothetical protein
MNGKKSQVTRTKGIGMRVTVKTNGDFPQPAPGTYLARCEELLDLGTQRSEYQGQVRTRPTILVGFELPMERIPSGDYQGQPFVVRKFYNMSLHEKSKLRLHLLNMRGHDLTSEEQQGGFELKELLGTGCLVTVTMSEGRARITGVAAMPRGSSLPEPYHPSKYLSLEAAEFDRAVFDSLPEWIRRMVETSPEYQALLS